MRNTHVFALSLIAAFAAAGAWLGCSSDTPAAAPDAGTAETGALDVVTTDAPQESGPSPDTEALNCSNYCARIQANCTGRLAQYPDIATCMKICADLPLGDAGETSGDTVGCRFYHAGAPAKQSPSFHCPHAGAFGAETCGKRCVAFCALADQQCPNAYGGDAGACDAACPSYAFDFDAGESQTGPTSGDTLNCREYHLLAAFVSPDPHCGHIGPTPKADAAALPCH